MNGLEISNVGKNYGSVRALDNVSLNFAPGKIYGLLGRNGAGKTTLLNIITGRIFADCGRVVVDGEPALENDRALGKMFMTGESTLYPDGMRVREAMAWTGRFYPEFDRAYAEETARRFGLGLNKKVKALSTGYKSVFKLTLALAVNTPYLLLDEPVLGLDANNRDLFYRLLLEKCSERPCTVIISTHLIEEISPMIEEIVIIKEGRIIANESREQLLARGYAASGPASLVDAYTTGKNVLGTDVLGGLKTAYLLGRVEDNPPSGLEISRIDLQKLFIQLTN